jgi:two-component system, NarL family, sensor kinase
MTPSDNQIALFFAVGTSGMLFMATAIVVFVAFYQKKMLLEQLKLQKIEEEYQRKMLAAALESQESERKRVSKDLHDDVGMMLMTVRAQINSIIGQTFSNESAGNIRQLVDETHESVRRISWDLMPSTLERFGLLQAVRELCSRLHQDGISVEFEERGEGSALDQNQETHLYRIIQETVSNAIRHSQGTRICVLFHWSEQDLNVLVSDDGKGFDFPQENSKIQNRVGLGLINLENRVSILNAKLQFEKNNPTGTIVNLKLPVRQYA